MASRFGAKIVPFGAVGEDDIGEVRPHTLFYIYCYLIYLSLLNKSTSLLSFGYSHHSFSE